VPIRPLVGISLGDPSGIGPEVVARALALPRVLRALTPVVFGDRGALEAVAASLGARTLKLAAASHPLAARPSRPTLVEVSALPARLRRPGKPTAEGGRAQLDYVRAAIAAGRAGRVDALCTAPVSKEQISRAGIPFMGHTEVLAEAFGCEVLMLMAGPRVRVALATNHLPLAEVPAALSTEKLAAQIALLARGVRPLCSGRRAVRLAVCGLNPHAGEGGLLGREEVEIIAPAVALARSRGVRVEGPLPADGLFARAVEGMAYDAVLAMFHDQGLVVAKALDFAETVNVTLGLPLPRTSPDHGTAYDLAGKGRASPAPMVAALQLAAQLAGTGRS
jgi:4-hydroxythreonine-4-phosphate dehydrogenase